MKDLIKSAVRGNGTPIKFERGDILLHKKGNYYIVLMFGKHSETEEVTVAYQSLVTKAVFFRPLAMFTPDRFTVAIIASDLKEVMEDES